MTPSPPTLDLFAASLRHALQIPHRSNVIRIKDECRDVQKELLHANLSIESSKSRWAGEQRGVSTGRQTSTMLVSATAGRHERACVCSCSIALLEREELARQLIDQRHA